MSNIQDIPRELTSGIKYIFRKKLILPTQWKLFFPTSFWYLLVTPKACKVYKKKPLRVWKNMKITLKVWFLQFEPGFPCSASIRMRIYYLKLVKITLKVWFLQFEPGFPCSASIRVRIYYLKFCQVWFLQFEPGFPCG